MALELVICAVQWPVERPSPWETRKKIMLPRWSLLLLATLVGLASASLLDSGSSLAQEVGGSANQAAPAPGGVPAGGAAAPAPSLFGDNWLIMLMPVVLIVVIMMSMRPQNKDQKKREDMLKQLKKNDKIVTIGGIVAKVAAIKAENQTVKLMLDENSNSTMTVRVSAIAKILTGDEKIDNKEE